MGARQMTAERLFFRAGLASPTGSRRRLIPARLRSAGFYVCLCHSLVMNYKHWGGTEAQMILIRMGRHGLCALLALSAVQANADVLEISDDGARWVTGALASVPADVAAEMVDVSVPDVAVADAQLQARIVPRYYAAKVAELSARYDLSPALIEALVWQESRWNAAAVSPKGAQGLARASWGSIRATLTPISKAVRVTCANSSTVLKAIWRRRSPRIMPGPAGSSAPTASRVFAKLNTMLRRS